MIQERIAIIDGARTPMGKVYGFLDGYSAQELGAMAVRELLERTPIKKEHINEVIIGNVGQPVEAQNISRVISLLAGLPESIPAYTVHRNCASGLEAVTTAATKIWCGKGEIFVVGGVESMSNIPLLFSKKFSRNILAFTKSKGILEKVKALSQIKLSSLKPLNGLLKGLTDPTCNMNMGQTAEVLAKEFNISREKQDSYALESHKRAQMASEAGVFKEEVFSIPNKETGMFIENDEGIRAKQTMEALAKLQSVFDRSFGSVTAGNASQISDGAAALLLMSESEAKKQDLEPLAYLRYFEYVGVDPKRMGLGPLYATAKLFKSSGFSLREMDIIEMNEAFAAQVLANEIAFNSKAFAEKNLGLEKALGEIDPQKLNIHGGAIAMGHPVGMTGARLVLHIAKTLRKIDGELGLVTLCIGGGQGASAIIERA